MKLVKEQRGHTWWLTGYGHSMQFASETEADAFLRCKAESGSLPESTPRPKPWLRAVSDPPPAPPEHPVEEALRQMRERREETKRLRKLQCTFDFTERKESR